MKNYQSLLTMKMKRQLLCVRIEREAKDQFSVVLKYPIRMTSLLIHNPEKVRSIAN